MLDIAANHWYQLIVRKRAASRGRVLSATLLQGQHCIHHAPYMVP